MIATSILLWTLVLLALAFIYYVRYVEPAQIVTERVDVKLEPLPRQLADLRIGIFCDTHMREDDWVNDLARQAVRRVMNEKPDIIFLPGDMAHHSYYLDIAAEVLEPLSAPYGVYSVIGNHDQDLTLGLTPLGPTPTVVSVETWMERMEEVGVNLLYNQHHELVINDTTVVIVGVGDPSCGLDDLTGTLENVPEADLHLLIAHSPDIFDHPAVHWADLIVCGHTHGGQIQIPGIGSPWAPVWRDRHRACGLMRVGNDGTMAYVSRGVSSGTRARFNCPPEVAILTLTEGRAEDVRQIDPLPGYAPVQEVEAETIDA